VSLLLCSIWLAGSERDLTLLIFLKRYTNVLRSKDEKRIGRLLYETCARYLSQPKIDLSAACNLVLNELSSSKAGATTIEDLAAKTGQVNIFILVVCS